MSTLRVSRPKIACARRPLSGLLKSSSPTGSAWPKTDAGLSGLARTSAASSFSSSRISGTTNDESKPKRTWFTRQHAIATSATRTVLSSSVTVGATKIGSVRGTLCCAAKPPPLVNVLGFGRLLIRVVRGRSTPYRHDGGSAPIQRGCEQSSARRRDPSRRRFRATRARAGRRCDDAGDGPGSSS